MEIDGKFIKFFELRTEDGPLYLYEVYQLNPSDNNHEIPITREFFTQEEGIRNYHSLDFLDGGCRYTTQYYTMQGEFVENYLKELSPAEFLKKVKPYLKDEELRYRKAEDIYFNMKNKCLQNEKTLMKIDSYDKSLKQKNEVAQKVLRRYIKTES